MELTRKSWRSLQTVLLTVYDAGVAVKNRRLLTTLPHYVLWFIRERKVRVGKDSENQFTLYPGDWCLFPPYYPKKHQFEDGAHIISCHFSAEWPGGVPLFDLQQPLSWQQAVCPELETQIKLLLLGNSDRPPSVLTFEQMIKQTSAFHEVLLLLQKILADHGVNMTQHQHIDPRVERALTILSGCQQCRIVPYDSLIQASGLSKIQLDRLFVAELGKTPSKYLEQINLQCAIKLLNHSPLSGKEICFEMGFSDLPQFSKWLKRLTGQSLREFRNETGRRNPSLKY